MPDKKPRLTPPVRARIVAAIHAGGYPHVAAQAHGIPSELFDSWIKRGSEKGARDPYAAFAREVRQARAEARLLAECNVFKSDPKVWLEHGPGREAPDNPGWSSPVKPSETTPMERNLFFDTQLMALCRAVLAALTPFPEARLQVADALLQQGFTDASLHHRKDSPEPKIPETNP